MRKQKIVLASDHAGFELKEHIRKSLTKSGYEVLDLGAKKYDPKDDYPDFIVPAAKKVVKEKRLGIVLGGSGQGEAIAANKVKGARAALYYGKNPKIIKLSKTHNNANILSLGARFLTKTEAISAVKLWLKTNFSNKPRHKRRIKKLDRI